MCRRKGVGGRERRRRKRLRFGKKTRLVGWLVQGGKVWAVTVLMLLVG